MPAGKVNRRVTRTRRHAYESMVAKGVPQTSAAKIANAGKTKTGRSRMAKKAARTRKRRSR